MERRGRRAPGLHLIKWPCWGRQAGRQGPAPFPTWQAVHETDLLTAHGDKSLEVTPKWTPAPSSHRPDTQTRQLTPLPILDLANGQFPQKLASQWDTSGPCLTNFKPSKEEGRSWLVLAPSQSGAPALHLPGQLCQARPEASSQLGLTCLKTQP